MISVCVTTYNGADYIESQLRSILVQLSAHDEVIVSDDGSADETMQVIRGIGDKRIRVLEHPHVGVTRNFYAALDEAKGEYIFLADQDDVWLENKVSRCVECLQKYDLVVTDAKVTDESLCVVEKSLFELLNSREGLWKNWFACTFYGSMMAFRRSVLDAAHPYPSSTMIAHDWWIGMVAEMKGKVCFLKEPLVLYRRHAGTMTQVNKKPFLTRSPRPLHIKIVARVYMLYYIIRYRLSN